MRRLRAGLAMLGWLAVAATPGLAAGQEGKVSGADLPQAVADQVIAFMNDPATLRLSGNSRIPQGRTVDGDLGVLGGPVVLGGTVRGDLVVVNGDVEFLEGARVEGDLLIIGGSLIDPEKGTVRGERTVYSQRLRYRHRGSDIATAAVVDRDEPGFSSNLGVGSVRFTVRSGVNYNRVEGLPVLFGPIFETSGPNTLRVDALAVWRSESGLELDTREMGYRVRVEQKLGGNRSFGIGGSIFSEYFAIEDWGLSNLEASLATFLFHSDFRDYVEREGWSVFGTFEPRGLPLTLTVDYREDRHDFGPVGDPWTILHGKDEWRAQPVVAQGDLRSVGVDLRFDTRNDRSQASNGVLVSVGSRFGVGGGWELPGGQPLTTDFSTGSLDVRTHHRIAPVATLNLRGRVAGSLTGDPLPPQYQVALGGAGSLPGFPLLFGDCGARSSLVQAAARGDREAQPAYPGYGCDRIALGQIELRVAFANPVEIGDSDDVWQWVPVLDLSPGWSVFVNGGRGWALSETFPGSTVPRVDTEELVDAGFGFHLGDFGLYWAFPLTAGENGSRFFARLQFRF